MLQNLSRNINGVNIPVFLIGDPAYPLKPWLLKGFSDPGHLTREQQLFNYRLSRARMVVECAFGRLKGRWRCLLKRNDTHLHKLSLTIAACCILHNICEEQNDEFEIEWDDVQEHRIPHEDNARNVGGEAVRAALVDYCAAGH